MHTALYTLNTTHWNLHTSNCTLHTAHCTVHSAHCRMHCTLLTAQYSREPIPVMAPFGRTWQNSRGTEDWMAVLPYYVIHCTVYTVTLLCCTALQDTVLHCSVWTVLCCTVLQDTVSYYIGPSFRDSPMFYLLWILANLRVIRSQIRE